MKSHHFKPDQYADWVTASKQSPTHVGWYECTGFRFDGFLHLFWDGAQWLYFGPKHNDPKFPQFGKHRSDKWRGLLHQSLRDLWGSRWVDYTRQRFGMLEALHLAYITPRGAFWLYQCDCGQRRVAQAKWVASGNTASCGCARHKRRSIPVSRPWDRAAIAAPKKEASA